MDLAMHHLSYKARAALKEALNHAHSDRRGYVELTDIEHGIKRVREPGYENPHHPQIRGGASGPGMDAGALEGGVA